MIDKLIEDATEKRHHQGRSGKTPEPRQKLNKAYGVFFQGADQARFDGMLNLVRHAAQVNRVPPGKCRSRRKAGRRHLTIVFPQARNECPPRIGCHLDRACGLVLQGDHWQVAKVQWPTDIADANVEWNWWRVIPGIESIVTLAAGTRGGKIQIVVESSDARNIDLLRIEKSLPASGAGAATGPVPARVVVGDRGF